MRSRSIRAVLALAIVLTLTACPKPDQKAVDSAAKSSRELAHDVVTTERVVGLLFTQGKISLEQKDTIAKSLKTIAVNGQRFNDAVIRMNEQAKAGTLPANWRDVLLTEWRPILSAFNDVTGVISKLTGDTQKQLTSAAKPLKDDVNNIDSKLNK